MPAICEEQGLPFLKNSGPYFGSIYNARLQALIFIITFVNRMVLNISMQVKNFKTFYNVNSFLAAEN